MERVALVAEEVAVKMAVVWDEVGLSPVEREAQMHSVRQELEEMLLRRLKDEESLRDQYVLEAQTIEQDISRLAARLCAGEKVAPVCIPSTESQNLTRKLTWLRAERERARSKCREREGLFLLPMKTLHGLWTDMGCEFDPEFADIGDDLRDDRLTAFHKKVKEVEQVRENRISAIQHEVVRLTSLFDELDMNGATGAVDRAAGPACCITELDRKIIDGDTSLGISWQILDALASRAEGLIVEKRRRQALLKDLGNVITPLWDKLKIPPAERESFFAKNVGIGLQVMRRCEEEVRRLQLLKKENIVRLVQDAQSKILALWDELGTPESCRTLPTDRVHPAGDDFALEACEGLIADLEQKAGQIRPILKAIHKRDECLGARNDFERSQADQSRLTKRGGDLTKQLFREEKLQKKMKLLPKVTGRIRQLIQTWQKEHCQVFVYNGEPFLRLMERQDTAYRQQKKDREAARKAAKIEEMKHELKFGTRVPRKKKKTVESPTLYPQLCGEITICIILVIIYNTGCGRNSSGAHFSVPFITYRCGVFATWIPP